MSRTAVDRTAGEGLLGQLTLAVEHLLPDHVATWAESLQRGRLTPQMVQVFVALGWLSSSQDPRLADLPQPEAAPPSRKSPNLPD